MSHSLQCGIPITAPNFPPSAYSRIDKLLHGDPYYSYKKKLRKSATFTFEQVNTPETNLVRRWVWHQEDQQHD